MRFLKRLIPWAVIVAALLAVVYIPELGPERHTDLASLFSRERFRMRNLGYAVAVVRNGSVVYKEAFGTDGARKPLGTDTSMYLGPTSEVLTGALLHSMAVSGKLSLDDDVRSHLPWGGLDASPEAAGTGAAPAADLPNDPRPAISIRDLAAHGVPLDPRHFADFISPSSGLEAGSLDAGSFLRIRMATGAYPRSRLAYRIIGKTMENVSRQSFETLLSERILIPLGMHGTTSDPESLAAIATGSGQFFGVAFPYNTRLTPVIAPADGIISTASDMGVFLAYITAPPRSGGIPSLPSRSVSALYQPVIPGSEGALGWRIADRKGDRLVFQGGSIDGFSSRAILWPERNAAIVILSAQGGIVQSNFVLPLLTDAAEKIIFGGSAPRLFPIGRVLLLLAVSAGVYFAALVIQTLTAVSWMRRVRDSTALSASRFRPWFSVLRTVAGILARVASVLWILPALAGLAAGFRLSLRDIFYAEPGMAAAFVALILMGVVRNITRLAWIFSSDLEVTLFPRRYRTSAGASPR